MGHARFVLSQRSMHAEWKLWKHGRVRISSPGSTSSRQMAHVGVPSPQHSPPSALWTGSASICASVAPRSTDPSLSCSSSRDSYDHSCPWDPPTKGNGKGIAPSVPGTPPRTMRRMRRPPSPGMKTVLPSLDDACAPPASTSIRMPCCRRTSSNVGPLELVAPPVPPCRTSRIPCRLCRAPAAAAASSALVRRRAKSSSDSPGSASSRPSASPARSDATGVLWLPTYELPKAYESATVANPDNTIAPTSHNAALKALETPLRRRALLPPPSSSLLRSLPLDMTRAPVVTGSARLAPLRPQGKT